jgi:hypothetical protein
MDKIGEHEQRIGSQIISKKRENRRAKYNTTLCNNTMTFQECELAILRNAVDDTEKIIGQKIANSDDVKRMIIILENFLIKKKLVCYGGTAINNILPKYAQFYNRDVEIPDYDFFSDNAMADAKELADIYYKAGYVEVEAKSGMHVGTFKVYVNFIPMADITMLNSVIYKNIQKEAITIAGIKYAPPDYLRMAMFLELSRPAGDVSRWEKVLKRLTLLNDHYPLKNPFNCGSVDFQRSNLVGNLGERIYYLVRDSFIEQGVIFFGGYAASLYSKYMPEKEGKLVKKVPDFDVLCDEPEKCAMITKEKLEAAGIRNITTIVHAEIGEIIPMHIEIQVNGKSVAFIYVPVACHNYNTIEIAGKEINVATIDTMLSFYLAFIYADKPYYTKDRILCMSKFLFEMEQKNRLEQKGLLKRFSIKCYGKQSSLEDIRAEKTEMFKKLATKKNTAEYEMWFLKYNPGLDKNGLPKKSEKEIRESVKNMDYLPKVQSLKYSANYKKQIEEEGEKQRDKKQKDKTKSSMGQIAEQQSSEQQSSEEETIRERPQQKQEKKRKRFYKRTKKRGGPKKLKKRSLKLFGKRGDFLF